MFYILTEKLDLYNILFCIRKDRAMWSGGVVVQFLVTSIILCDLN